MNGVEINSMNVKQLRHLATEYKVKNRSLMGKEELIAALTTVIEKHELIVVEDSNKQAQALNVASNTRKTTSDYVNDLKGGELIAFVLNGRTTLSGIVSKVEGNTVTVQTKEGSIIRVQKESVLWVRTGIRWPKWVYERFGKGKVVCPSQMTTPQLKG